MSHVLEQTVVFMDMRGGHPSVHTVYKEVWVWVQVKRTLKHKVPPKQSGLMAPFSLRPMAASTRSLGHWSPRG